MFQVTKYKNIKSSDVEDTLDIAEVFKIIKEGDSALNHIKYARSFNKGSEDYNSIKANLIPTFRFNFLFDRKASNKNITEPTGLIFIDVDNTDTILDNDFIFAKWKSISLKGYSILVKVDNLTVNNFNDTYDNISSLLKINSDIGARKPTQQTVQSYDPDIYINYDAKTYNCAEIKKVPSAIKQKKEKKCLTRNETFLPVSQNIKIRFNNIDDYFTDNNSTYIVFKEEKEKLCIPFIPRKVEEGNRNSYLFIYLSQIVALNPHINKAYVKAIADSVNLNVMHPELPESELNDIINSIFKIKESDELEMFYNKERRIIFNPKQKLPFKEKMKIVNKELGSMAADRTIEKIYVCIEEWDFQSYNKINQVKVADLMELHVSTIKRYWSNFKAFVKELNDDYKGSLIGDGTEMIECRIDYSNFYLNEPQLKKSA
ncbi:MAG: hypothetical protein K8F54_11710 [Altibacter sp.]|uniref:BT4734/BF3469 family protein n=1 Tax=Altibacter sp. TaxID=2024823 RepID=UPI001D87D904|nr:BT4734/BF3469 family protein [Altibacter sp.]MBZ0328265.1 hypothetical protein [Altibacter sp.]